MTRYGPIFFVMVFVVLEGCSQSPQEKTGPSPQQEKPSPRTQKERQGPKTKVVVLGDTSANELLEKAGCKVRSNVRPESQEPVLFAVSCRQGITDSTTKSWTLARGQQPNHLAILTEADASLDKDMVELVLMEAKEALGKVLGGEAVVKGLAVIRTDDNQLGSKIKELAPKSKRPVRMKKVNPK